MTMYKTITTVFFVLVLIILFADKYEAKADYRVKILNIEHKETREVKKILHLIGDFDEGITEDVKKLLDSHPDVDFATLSSPGGNGKEAYMMSNLFSDRMITTRVARGTYCLSSCAIAFIGGWNYQIDGGILGFHRAWYPEEPKGLTVSGAFETGQGFGAYSMLHYMNNGFSAQLAYSINNLTTPSKFLVFTNASTLNEEYVRKGKDTPFSDYMKFDTVNYQYFEGKDFTNYLKNNPNLREWSVLDLVEEHNNIKEKDMINE